MGILDAPPRRVGLGAHLYNFTPKNFLKWHKALTNVRLGLGDAKLCMVGDSNTEGFGTSVVARTTKNAYPAQLARRLTASGIPAIEAFTKNFQAGVITDDRVVKGGTWHTVPPVSGFGFGSQSTTRAYWETNSTGATLTFTPAVECDTFDVYYYAHTNTGTASVQATGGSVSNIPVGPNPPATALIYKLTVTAASLSASNSVVITKTATDTDHIFIIGIEARDSTKKLVRVLNTGFSGSGARHWVDANYPNGNGAAGIRAIAPDLTVISHGPNDVTVSSLATFKTDMQSLVTAAQVSGDVVILTPSPATGDWANVGTLVAPILELGVPVIDVHSAWAQTYAQMTTAGLTANDNVHLNNYSHARIADWVLSALSNV